MPVRPRLRDTARRNSKGEWDFDAIFNRELYPAIKSLEDGLSVSALFPPVELTGALNELIADYEHMNVLVDHSMPTQLTLSSADSSRFQLGAVVLLGQDGLGQLELVPGSGVTIETRQTLKLAGQYARAWLVKKGDLVWEVFGDLEPTPTVEALLIQDRFIGGNESATGNNTNANIGQLQWNTAFTSNAGTVARVAAVTGHPGIVRVSGHATLGGHQAMYLGHAATNGSVVALDEVEYFEFLVKNVGTGRFRFGIGDNAAAAGLGNNTMGFSADTDVNSVWYGFTNNGGSSSTVTSTVATSSSAWRTFRIQIVSSAEIQFFIDGALIGAITSNIPSFSTLMAPAVQAVTITPGPFQGIGEVDLFTMQMKAA